MIGTVIMLLDFLSFAFVLSRSGNDEQLIKTFIEVGEVKLLLRADWV